jgi:hypothetical protein
MSVRTGRSSYGGKGAYAGRGRGWRKYAKKQKR